MSVVLFIFCAIGFLLLVAAVVWGGLDIASRPRGYPRSSSWVLGLIALAVIILSLTSCAHPAVSPCPEPCVGDGLRFYRPTIYVLVAPDGTWRTVPLPDYSQQYILHVEGWLGDASLNPMLTDGWNFASMASGTNNDATLAAVVGAAGAAKGLMGGALFPRAAAQSVAPGLYRLDLPRDRLVGPLGLVHP